MKTGLSQVISAIFLLLLGATPAIAEEVEECSPGWEGPTDEYSIKIVGGNPKGNHQLDCTVIRPWKDDKAPTEGPYPIIGWANGWGGNEVSGEDEIDGYLPGLIDWAVEGRFIVIAARQWSARERDVLQCVAWLVEQNEVEGGEYEGLVDTGRIGLSGHSQGGGAVLRFAALRPS